MDKPDGGSAFPVVGMQQRSDQQFIGVFANGMTLRDYFAAQVLNGRLADSNADMSRHDRVVEAYGIADLMLKERAK